MSEVWRLLLTGPGSAAWNMALDESLLRLAADGGPHTIRFYSWDVPSLSIGSFQRVSDLDTDELHRRSIPLVRRPTGGRAVLHDSEITYSVAAPIPSPHFPSDLMGSYKKIGECFLAGLRRLGLDARLVPVDRKRARSSGYQHNPLCFSSPSWHEVLVGGKKLIGSAQRRLKGSFLQQGSIIIDRDVEGLASLLSKNESVSHDAARSALGDKMTGLAEHTAVTDTSRIVKCLVEGFAGVMGAVPEHGEPTAEELGLADALFREKYTTDGWNLNRTAPAVAVPGC